MRPGGRRGDRRAMGQPLPAVTRRGSDTAGALSQHAGGWLIPAAGAPPAGTGRPAAHQPRGQVTGTHAPPSTLIGGDVSSANTVGTPGEMVRYGVLGSLLIMCGDQQVTVTSAKQRAVLAVLLLRANRVVLTEQLIDEVWGERLPSSARELVATYIWRLRRLVGENSEGGDRLGRVPGGYRLRVGDGELDIAEFDRLSARGQMLLASGDAVNAASVLRTALDLWRGDRWPTCHSATVWPARRWPWPSSGLGRLSCALKPIWPSAGTVC